MRQVKAASVSRMLLYINKGSCGVLHIYSLFLNIFCLLDAFTYTCITMLRKGPESLQTNKKKLSRRYSSLTKITSHCVEASVQGSLSRASCFVLLWATLVGFWTLYYCWNDYWITNGPLFCATCTKILICYVWITCTADCWRRDSPHICGLRVIRVHCFETLIHGSFECPTHVCSEVSLYIFHFFQFTLRSNVFPIVIHFHNRFFMPSDYGEANDAYLLSSV